MKKEIFDFFSKDRESIKFLNDVLPDRMQNKTYMEKFMYIRKAIEYRVNQGIIG